MTNAIKILLLPFKGQLTDFSLYYLSPGKKLQKLYSALFISAIVGFSLQGVARGIGDCFWY